MNKEIQNLKRNLHKELAGAFDKVILLKFPNLNKVSMNWFLHLLEFEILELLKFNFDELFNRIN